MARAAAALSLMAGVATAQDFPERELLGVIMWGAGGATDVVARGVTPAVEEVLGKPIVMLNKSGAAGAISVAYVNAAPADGYTLLYGAENPQLHGVMGLSELDYRNFYPVNVLGRGVAVVVVRADAPGSPFKELVEDARPGRARSRWRRPAPAACPMSWGRCSTRSRRTRSPPCRSTARAVSRRSRAAMSTSCRPASRRRPSSSRAASSGHSPWSTPKASPPSPTCRPSPTSSRTWRATCPGAPSTVSGSGRRPDDVKAKLVEAFKVGAESEAFQTLMANRGNIMMNISGDEANAFLNNWQSVTTWVLQDGGATKRSPEEFGIPRP
ncbi:MAG: tripartite tricarboxylate transporter substrate-binding protein [Geminicoccaceae bacterium]